MESPQNLTEALAQAQSIVEAAEKRAAEIMANAEKLHQQAKEQGHAEGLAKGHSEVADTAVRLIEESARIGEKLSEEAAKLAIAICEKIIEKHVAVDESIVRGIALKALQESVIVESVTVVVNPKDKKILVENADQMRRLAGGAEVGVETDSSITRGGCLVRTDFGEVDATIEALVKALGERLGVS